MILKQVEAEQKKQYEGSHTEWGEDAPERTALLLNLVLQLFLL